MTSRVLSCDRFPLFDLPDNVLANVLQRCPPGSIAGFPLPLALAQVRVTGSVDPYWVRALLHLAANCPAVLGHLSRHLRSLDSHACNVFDFLEGGKRFSCLTDGGAKALQAVLPQLTRLDHLKCMRNLDLDQLSLLPTGLTQLVADLWVLIGATPYDGSSLLRLTALEELELHCFPDAWVGGGSLPRLRRLKCRWSPQDLGTFAPNLEALESSFEAEELEHLPRGLTELKFVELEMQPGSTCSIRLTQLRDLRLPSNVGLTEAFDLFGPLKALTSLEIDTVTNDNLPELVEVLKKGPEGLGLCALSIQLDASSSAVERLFRHLVEVQLLETDNPASLPWAALTRLNRLVLEVDGSKDASWVQPLSQLPGLKELEIRLFNGMPAGFGALNQCTKLRLDGMESTADLSCLQRLTRLQECHFDDSSRLPIECLGVLPDCLTKLHASDTHKSPELPFGAALQHLTALEDLEIRWPEGEDRVCDLSPLKRLTALRLDGVPCPLVRLGSLPCLRSVLLSRCTGVDTSLLLQLENARGLKELRLRRCGEFELLTDAGLKSLTRLSLLEELELDADYDSCIPVIRRCLEKLPLLSRFAARSDEEAQGFSISISFSAA